MFYNFPESYYGILRQEGAILLESSLPGAENCHSYLFTNPVGVLHIQRPGDLAALLAAVEAAVGQGLWAAGFVGYEAGYGMAKLGLQGFRNARQPLAWFGVYPQPAIFDHRTGQFDHAPTPPPTPPDDETYQVSDLHFDMDEAAYTEKVKQVKEHIRSGRTYQINLTGRYRFGFDGSPIGLYGALRQNQRVPYSAFLHVAGQHTLCLSPELFFRIEGQRIVARPMKGTAPRGCTVAEDAERAAWLQGDAKNRAENVMIVDLLRNDLGRISRVGSVRVPELFAVERYRTLFQMTSTVEATLADGWRLPALFESLFPCGSVTGAPKLSSMGIIHELESSPRGVYTGAIGFVAPPTAPGPRAVFNVAIRTLVLDGVRGEMGVGSGIVWDSDAAEEWAECAAKARFLAQPPVPFELLESILWADGFQRLPRHLRRMEQSAAYFDFPWNPEAAQTALAQAATPFEPAARYKVRLRLSRAGDFHCEAQRLDGEPPAAELHVGLSYARTASRDCFLRHKTTRRALYDRALRAAREHGLADVLFLNERDEVTEGAIHTLFVERAGRLLTPPLRCGLLPGIWREQVLEENPLAEERVLHLSDLETADALYLCNAIRGWRRVTLEPVWLNP